MNTFFLRVYFSALAFFVISFFIIVYLTNILIFGKVLPEETTVIHQSIETSLLGKPPQQWQQEIKTYNAIVGDYDLLLQPIDSLNAIQKQALLAQGNYQSDITVTQNNLYILYPIADSGWVLKIDENNVTGNRSVDFANDVIFFVMFLLPLAFALYWLVRKLTKPINHLSQVAEKLGEGDLNVRAHTNLTPPMNTLADGFNHMAEHLDKTICEQQVMIGAIPHELRTPLGRIRFALDITRTKQTVPELRQQIEKIDHFVDDMQETVDNILQLNRLQNNDDLMLEAFFPCSMIEESVKMVVEAHPHINYEMDCQYDEKVQGNLHLIKHAINNLLENASRYANKHIHIRIWQQDGQTRIRVDDDGTGIPDDQLSSVFTPFATLDKSRNRQSGGLGLGLALVNIIMKKHQGSATANNNPKGGARFELRW